MKITTVKTEKIVPGGSDIFSIINKALPTVKDCSILVMASKILSITQGRVVKIGSKDKEKLTEEEADLYLPPQRNSYNISLTITRNILIPHAGIDESNGAGYFVLWPSDPYLWANRIRAYLKDKYYINNVGVVITDSKTTPLRWGTSGVAIAYSGIKPLKNYIGKKDLFGRKLQYTQASIIDGLAAAAVVIMGEGAEQTPLAIIEELENIEFIDHDPTQEELDSLKISIKDDLYSPLLTSVKWKRGKV